MAKEKKQEKKPVEKEIKKVEKKEEKITIDGILRTDNGYVLFINGEEKDQFVGEENAAFQQAVKRYTILSFR